MIARMSLFVTIVSLVAACGHVREGDGALEVRSSTPVETARALRDRGDSLGASRYLERAASDTENERVVLPELMAAQIRSGRLLAALGTTRRMIELAPECDALRRLEALLVELLGLPRRAGEPEARR